MAFTATTNFPARRTQRGVNPQTPIGWQKPVALVILWATLVVPPMLSAEPQMLDRIVAIVDEDVVMASELEEQVDILTRQYASAQRPLPPRDRLVPQVLDKLILDRLQMDIARQSGVEISDQELNETLANTAAQRGITPEEFVQMAVEDGITTTQFREQFRQEILLSRVQRGMVDRRIEITDQEIENFLKSDQGRLMASPDVHVGHILLRLAPSADENTANEVLTKAEELRQQIIGGEKFSDVALVNSAGPNALKGGDLGWRKAAQLPTIFTEVLDNLAPGEISTPLRSEAGVHLLMLYDRRGADDRLIDQSKARHILLKPNAIRDDQETRELTANLRERILAGEDFGELAREFSEDTGSALKGGDLGWSVAGQFVAEFEDAINRLSIGEISEPVNTQFGWHIIEVTERRKQDFSDKIKRNRAISQLRQQRFAEELQVWLNELRAKAYIEIKL
ncbi:MAG TPA: molecular chaperone SurA [Porticoccaceae bacterium]|nr:molecular chaperone SurA [Porticoccaceae bacterium]